MNSDQDQAIIHVIFGSQTGNAEVIAMDTADAFTAAGFTAELVGMDEIGLDDVTAMSNIALVSSTYDDGDMPDNAQDLWDELDGGRPDLSGIRYAVLALGDSSYDDFCAAGRHFDELFEALGADRLIPRVDCDLDFERPSREWTQAVVRAWEPDAASETGHSDRTALASTPPPSEPSDGPAWTRAHPFSARLTAARRLSGELSEKDVHHYEIDLMGSDMVYQPGDSLGIIPTNSPCLVDAALVALGVDADSTPAGRECSWRDVLAREVELRLPSRNLAAWAAGISDDAPLTTAAANGRESLDVWLEGRDVVDVLSCVRPGALDAEAALAQLSTLQHRTYSLSSAPAVHADTAHLLVSHVRYEREERERIGAGSFTLSACEEGSQVPVFLVPNHTFRLPPDDVPVLMIGPGVGVAPFRSFLQERQSRGAQGPNWLFFGDQHEASDFYYREEFDAWLADGLLAKISTAFSRDQDRKIYVQDRLVAEGGELFNWLERGAHVYICGDEHDMAHGVEAALVEIVAKNGHRTDDEARSYLADLKKARRLSFDVY